MLCDLNLSLKKHIIGNNRVAKLEEQFGVIRFPHKHCFMTCRWKNMHCA